MPGTHSAQEQWPSYSLVNEKRVSYEQEGQNGRERKELHPSLRTVNTDPANHQFGSTVYNPI